MYSLCMPSKSQVIKGAYIYYSGHTFDGDSTVWWTIADVFNDDRFPVGMIADFAQV